MPESVGTLIIGAGQAGLAAGYHLAEQHADFLIVDAQRRVGDTWRTRWDSLRLFTPARMNHLPDMPFPASDWHLPTKDEMAEYLEGYADRFDLPARMETRVASLSLVGGQFVAETNRGTIEADNVIVATGAFSRPVVPPFGEDMDEHIIQIHSQAYRNPDQLNKGDVLVVGAGNSGAQIAVELSQSRTVWLSGPDTGSLPRSILGRDLYWWIWPTLLRISVDSRFGRRIREKALWSGDPLIGMDRKQLLNENIRRIGRTVSVRDGRPELADGQILDVANVLWCTGFRPDFSWIDLPVFGEDGYPIHRRGVVSGAPGLYFIGLRFLYRFRSSLIGGVGEDAAYVVDHLTSRS